MNKASQQWKLIFTRDAQKDSRNLASAGLRSKAQSLLDILRLNPFQTPPPYEKLVGDLDGAYSRRINIQHRLVYAVDIDSKTIKILRMWTHYQQRGNFCDIAYTQNRSGLQRSISRD